MTVDTIRLSIRLFSLLRERVGRGKLEWSLPTGSTGHDLLERLAEAYPVIREQKASIRIAINDSYVSLQEPLSEGDDVALLTPVSGG